MSQWKLLLWYWQRCRQLLHDRCRRLDSPGRPNDGSQARIVIDSLINNNDDWYKFIDFHYSSCCCPHLLADKLRPGRCSHENDH